MTEKRCWEASKHHDIWAKQIRQATVSRTPCQTRLILCAGTTGQAKHLTPVWEAACQLFCKLLPCRHARQSHVALPRRGKPDCGSMHTGTKALASLTTEFKHAGRGNVRYAAGQGKVSFLGGGVQQHCGKQIGHAGCVIELTVSPDSHQTLHPVRRPSLRSHMGEQTVRTRAEPVSAL